MHAVRLANGVELTIRPIRPDDKARLAAGHDLLSPDTQRLRFLMPKPRLSAADLRYLTEIDGIDHVAFVAVPTARDDVTMAVGRFVRDPAKPDTAEFAIVVADELQGLGLGSRLAEVLAEAAVERGIRRFSATVLRENRAVQRLLARISLRLDSARWSEGEGELVYALRPARARPATSPSRADVDERRAAVAECPVRTAPRRAQPAPSANARWLIAPSRAGRPRAPVRIGRRWRSATG